MSSRPLTPQVPRASAAQQDSSVSEFKPVFKGMRTQRVSWTSEVTLGACHRLLEEPTLSTAFLPHAKPQGFLAPQFTGTFSIQEHSVHTYGPVELGTPAALKPPLPVPEGSWWLAKHTHIRPDTESVGSTRGT